MFDALDRLRNSETNERSFLNEPHNRTGLRSASRAVRRAWVAPEIARLGPDDAADYIDHLLRLPSDDRRQRFGQCPRDGFIRRYVDRMDWQRAFVLGYRDRGVLRGAAHVAWPDVAWLDGAEIALAVEPEWQRCGIGSALVRRAVLEACARHLPALCFYGFADNEGLRRLLHRFGGAPTVLRGEVEGRIPLPVVPGDD